MTPKTTKTRAWQDAWREKLARCHKRLWLKDLDGTCWGDILVVLNEAFGPLDETGEKRWKRYDRAFKIEGTMTNGAHLEAEYRDLLAAKSLSELIAWLKDNHRLVPGIKEFMARLAANQISPVCISNGACEIAHEMMSYHGIEMPGVCNSLLFTEAGEFDRMDFFHDEHVGIDKGELVKLAVELGYEVVGCSGDSKGDISLVTETARVDGITLSIGTHGLTDWIRTNEGILVPKHTWFGVSDYTEALEVEAVTSRIDRK